MSHNKEINSEDWILQRQIEELACSSVYIFEYRNEDHYFICMYSSITKVYYLTLDEGLFHILHSWDEVMDITNTKLSPKIPAELFK